MTTLYLISQGTRPPRGFVYLSEAIAWAVANTKGHYRPAHLWVDRGEDRPEHIGAWYFNEAKEPTLVPDPPKRTFTYRG